MPEAQSQPHCVILLSGGLDSTTLLAMAAAENHGITALSFRYGQRHAIELDAAQKIAAHYGVSRHIIIELDLGRVGGSALTSEIDVPKGRSADDMAGEIPVTYVPARNTIFLAYALAWAEVTGAEKILIGVNALDYSGYPDCRPEYIEAFQKLAALATKTGVEGTTAVTIAAPLINLNKAEIIRTGLALGVDYAVTTSCYDPSPEGEACGACDACVLRLQGFAANNMDDPAPYRQKPNRT